MVSEVFKTPVAGGATGGGSTVLEALQAGITMQLAAVDDASLTGTGQSSAEVLGVPGTVVAAKLSGHLVREIMVRGAHGGPLFPLASQLNDDITHLRGQRLEDMVGGLASDLRAALAPLEQQGAKQATVVVARPNETTDMSSSPTSARTHIGSTSCKRC